MRVVARNAPYKIGDRTDIPENDLIGTWDEGGSHGGSQRVGWLCLV